MYYIEARRPWLSRGVQWNMNQLATIAVAFIGAIGVVIGAFYAYRASVINSLMSRVSALEKALSDKEEHWSERYDRLNARYDGLNLQYNSLWSEMLTVRDENVNLREQLQLYIK